MKRTYILILLLAGCRGGFIGLPETRILNGPPDGTVVYNNTIKFVWEGNEYTTEFRYCIDTILSEWTDAESITLILDEGWHTFSVYGRNLIGEIEKTYPRTAFLVDGIRNGFSLAPLLDTVSITRHFTIFLRAETPCLHRYEHFVIKWDKSKVEFSGILYDSSSYSPNALPVIITRSYEDSAEIFLSMLGGDFPEQDRVICSIEFVPINSGECDFILDGEIFDSTGTTIPLDTLQGGRIVIL